MKNAPSIIDVKRKYDSTELCVQYLEAMRWPEGVRCLVCGVDKISKFVTNETTRERKNRKGETKVVKVPARHLYTCLEPTCGFQFSPTAGTIFHDTHLPLSTWFQAVALMCNAKKGLSAKQMERDLGVTYRTAWYLCHRIRKAMEDGAPGLLTGVVEADEYYHSGVYDKRRKVGKKDKQPMFGALQRSADGAPSKVRAFPLKKTSGKYLTAAVKSTISTEANIFITDEHPAYITLGKQYQHETVNHIQLEYVRKGDPRWINRTRLKISGASLIVE